MEFMDVVQSVNAEIERERDSQSFFSIAEKPFADVISSRLHVRALNKLLCAVRDEHLPITARHTSGRYIILHSSPLSSWALIFHDVPSQYLYLSPVYVLQANVGEPSSLSAERYRCSAPQDFGYLDNSVECWNFGGRIARGRFEAKRYIGHSRLASCQLTIAAWCNLADQQLRPSGVGGSGVREVRQRCARTG